MIRIDTTKIEKWDEIKEKHLKAVKLIVKEKIEKFKKENNSYVLKNKKKEIIFKFGEKDKNFLEKLLGLKIRDRDSNSYLKVEFKNDKEIEIFAIGRMDDLFEKINSEFYEIIKESCTQNKNSQESDVYNRIIELEIYISNSKHI